MFSQDVIANPVPIVLQCNVMCRRRCRKARIAQRLRALCYHIALDIGQQYPGAFACKQLRRGKTDPHGRRRAGNYCNFTFQPPHVAKPASVGRGESTPGIVP